MFHVPNEYRLRHGMLATDDSQGNNGAFLIKINGAMCLVIATDGEGWEHVSVSFNMRCPTWGEMCLLKEIFWDDEDCVVQYHPPRKDYVNNHQFCLHLWRPIGIEMPAPPSILVGIKLNQEQS